jgi:hypothetical protein
MVLLNTPDILGSRSQYNLSFFNQFANNYDNYDQIRTAEFPIGSELKDLITTAYQAREFVETSWDQKKGQVKIGVADFISEGARQLDVKPHSLRQRVEGYLSAGDLANVVQGRQEHDSHEKYRDDAARSLAQAIVEQLGNNALSAPNRYRHDDWKAYMLKDALKSLIGQDRTNELLLYAALDKLFREKVEHETPSVPDRVTKAKIWLRALSGGGFGDNGLTPSRSFWRGVALGKVQLVFDDELFKQGGVVCKIDDKGITRTEYRQSPGLDYNDPKYRQITIDVRSILGQADADNKQTLERFGELGILSDLGMVRDMLSKFVKDRISQWGAGTKEDRALVRESIKTTYMEKALEHGTIAVVAGLAAGWMINGIGNLPENMSNLSIDQQITIYLYVLIPLFYSMLMGISAMESVKSANQQ